MTQRIAQTGCPCGRVPRRAFLADVGMGFTGLAAGALLAKDGIVRGAEPAWSPPDGLPHLPPRIRSVIWIYLSGGYSHLETFDPKPALDKYAGKTFADTPYPNPFDSPVLERRSRSVIQMQRERFGRIFPLQVGYRQHGQSGIEISDYWPHLARHVDDMCFVRSMYTTDNDHAAENQFHTGRHKLDETQPSVGSWVQYGLGSLNENLPEFVVLGGPTRPDTRESIDSYYLGPQYAGIPLAVDPKNPLPNGRRRADVLADEQRNEYELIGQLNRLSGVEYPQDPALAARIRSYELAFGMQMAVPEALDLAGETAVTREQYGLNQNETRLAGERCLAARRLVEREVRFVQVYPSSYGLWDSHTNLRGNHAIGAKGVDQPVAALLGDLKQRGLMDQTLVVFGTEFGRTPGIEERGGTPKNGRDHHPHGFTVWLAGDAVKGGHVHGATDELGFHAVENEHYVTDLHATVLHLLGLSPRRLAIPGRKRLEVDYGEPILEILS